MQGCESLFKFIEGILSLRFFVLTITVLELLVVTYDELNFKFLFFIFHAQRSLHSLCFEFCRANQNSIESLFRIIVCRTITFTTLFPEILNVFFYLEIYFGHVTKFKDYVFKSLATNTPCIYNTKNTPLVFALILILSPIFFFFSNNESSKCIINPNQELCTIHVKALTLMSTSQRWRKKKINLRSGELVGVSYHTSFLYSHSTSFIWEAYDDKPFFSIFPHHCKTKHEKKRANMKTEKIFFLNKLTFV